MESDPGVYSRSIADHDAGDRATLDEYGIGTEAAYKPISTGIQAVQDRLVIQPDGKPRLFIFENAVIERDSTLRDRHYPTSTREEFSLYTWPETRSVGVKEVPVDLHNHGMDAMRYMVAALDRQSVNIVSESRQYA
jgi:phage terminase large subunit